MNSSIEAGSAVGFTEKDIQAATVEISTAIVCSYVYPVDVKAKIQTG
jgi:hypothetical protein